MRVTSRLGSEDARATDREADLDARQIRVEADEARSSERADQADQILAAAVERDERAEIRDEEADAREQVSSLHSFLHDPEYDATLKARRAAPQLPTGHTPRRTAPQAPIVDDG